MKRNVLFFLFFLLIWHAFHKVFGIADYVLPAPLDVAKAFQNHTKLLYQHTLHTLQLILIGFFTSIVLAFFTAIVLDHFPKTLSWVRSVVLSLQSIPSIVLLPLLIIWFGCGFLPRLMIMTLSCYFPITLCCINGLTLTSEDYKTVIKLLDGRYWQRLYHVRLPNALPHIFSGLQIAAISTPLNAIAVDWIGSSQGLGYLIMLSHGNLKTDIMIAATIVVIVIAWFLYRLVSIAKRQLLFWEI